MSESHPFIVVWTGRFCLLGLLVVPGVSSGQGAFAQPYSAALRTDPAVGNVQGIQRYGRPLKTDPDQGEGYSYHVYPVTHVGGGVGPGGTGLQSGAIGNPTAFDWTSGIRNGGTSTAPPAMPIPGGDDQQTRLESGAISRQGLSTTKSEIYQQPLIQIKLRVVEVNRTDGVAVGSVLEYVSRGNSNPSLTSGQTSNFAGAQGFENFRSTSRLLLPNNVAQSATAGTGALLNLTSEHINWLVQGLATELKADVITAPEVVTLNGQNVEFVSGNKLPFQLGQNVIQGSNNNIQQVFYKHVGTMVSVTPRIVNWGFHGEGQGEASIQGSEIKDWQGLVETMLAQGITHQPGSPEVRDEEGQVVSRATVTVDIKALLEQYRGQQFVPFSAQSEILKALNNYSRGQLQLVVDLAEQNIITEAACDRCRRWQPEDCMIDLAVVVRLSEGGTGTVPDPDDPDSATLSGNTEANIRAVANVIQVQSGHGVVMAGLIGEREINDESKVPILGDLPLVGIFFRSKSVNREKTEVLIFVEAQVLDSEPEVARAESAHDFLLGQPYVQGDVLDNPLEAGMHRIGFGTYLPPHSRNEQIYWENYHRNIRQIRTHVSDVVSP